MKKKPNFFIVGAAKCGTTSMWAYLRQHPDIFMPEMKEPHFFSMDINFKMMVKKRVKNEKEYYKLFLNVKEEKMIGEASPSYLYSKVAAQNIKRFNPDSRIIIMLRNPVDTICSMFHMLYVGGKEHNHDLADALTKGIKFNIINSTDRTRYYIDRVQYSHQITRYTNLFAKNKIHFIFFDDLKETPNIVIRKVFEFLQVDSNFLPDFQIHNPARPIRNLYVTRFFTSHPLLVKLNLFTKNLPFRHLIGDLVASNVGGLNNLEPIIREETRNKLKIELKPEVGKLSKLLNRDLSHWCNLDNS